MTDKVVPPLFQNDELIVFSGGGCCFTAFSTDYSRLLGCASKHEVLCLEEECCCRTSTPLYDLQLRGKEGPYYCTLATVCCQASLRWPTVLLRAKNQLCCFINHYSLPPSNEVPCICGVCFMIWFPLCGVWKKLSEVQDASIESLFTN